VMEPNSAVFCFPRIPAAGTAEAACLRDFAATRRGALEMTPEMENCTTLNFSSPTLEHFYSFFYCSASEQAECKRLVRDHVKFPTGVATTARQIAAYMGDYHAVHVRRGDFFTQYPEQDIAPNRLHSNLARHVPAGTKLYIATDERDRNFFAGWRYKIYFLDDFRELVPSNLPAHSIACLEQMICAFASRFIGTRLSTFSGYITRLRGYYGAIDKNIYFSDGGPGSDFDDRGLPRYSWINWLKNGSPIWGREFREAWEF